MRGAGARQNAPTCKKEEEGKCGAFLKMPSDELPPSGSEGAIPYKQEEMKNGSRRKQINYHRNRPDHGI